MVVHNNVNQTIQIIFVITLVFVDLMDSIKYHNVIVIIIITEIIVSITMDYINKITIYTII